MINKYIGKYTIEVPSEFRSGTKLLRIKKEWEELREEYLKIPCILVLDLGNVVYMDASSFKLVFDFLPIFTAVLPPKSEHVIERYNLWLDSKKGLSK